MTRERKQLRYTGYLIRAIDALMLQPISEEEDEKLHDALIASVVRWQWHQLSRAQRLAQRGRPQYLGYLLKRFAKTGAPSIRRLCTQELEKRKEKRSKSGKKASNGSTITQENNT